MIPSRCRALALLTALCFAGCIPRLGDPYEDQPRLPKKPGQETAELIIQRELADLTGWQPPTPWRMPEVEWIEGPALTCYGEGWYAYWKQRPDGTCSSGTAVATSPPGGPGITGGGPACRVCLLGQALLSENIIQSNWSETLPAYHQKSLVHEYCHFFQLWATGSSDSGHAGPCYTGPRWIDTVKRALESAGL